MILNDSEIKHKALREFWKSGGKVTKGLPSGHISNLRLILVHLHSARSLNDIAVGFGQVKRHHKLQGYSNRYAMTVNGNYRITYDCDNPNTGVVTVIDYEDYH